MFHPLESLQTNPFVLAPMAGITDNAFRSFMREMGCGAVVTELVSSHGIEHGGRNTIRLTQYEDTQRPIAIQLFGEEPEVVARAAQWVESKGADFVDLNFGCPVPKVVTKGAGSAILKDLVALEKMVTTVKKAIQIPLTIKIRTGWDEKSRNAAEVCNVAYNAGVTWVAIHGRTRAQGYSGLADWDFIGDVKAKTKIPVLGNGDIHTAEQAVKRLKTYNLDGVMIGRGCLKNPWIFKESMSLLNGGSGIEQNKSFELVFNRLKWYLEKQCDEKVLSIQLKKFASWFSTGYAGASAFRKALFACQDNTQLLTIINHYFAEMRNREQADTSRDEFLMGGHG